MRYMVALAVLGVILAGAGQAMAVPVVGDWGVSESWYSHTAEGPWPDYQVVYNGAVTHTPGPVDRIEYYWISGSQFEKSMDKFTNGETGAANPGWKSVFSSATAVAAVYDPTVPGATLYNNTSGGNDRGIWYDLNFVGTQVYTIVQLQAYKKNAQGQEVLVDCWRLDASTAYGSYWAVDLGHENGMSLPGVPEPLTMAGLFMGICSVVGYARKRSKGSR